MSFPVAFILILFIFLYAMLEIRPLIKKHEFKDLLVGSLLFLLALSYGIDYAMDWMKLPNPNQALYVVEPISQAFERFFQTNQ